MKLTNSLTLLLFMSGLALAVPPENRRADRYKDLYLNSPITDAPPVDIVDEIPSDLPDWVLVGVTKYIGKTKVQIMNIKDRSRVVIPSKEASDLGFSIKEVIQGRNYLDDTVVTLQKGKDTGEVRFDPKFLVLKRVSGPAAVKGKRPGAPQNKAKGRGGKKPPTPSAGRKPATKANKRVAPPRPGSVPRPSTSASRTGGNNASTNRTNTNSANTNSTNATATPATKKRTRYVPRPKR